MTDKSLERGNMIKDQIKSLEMIIGHLTHKIENGCVQNRSYQISDGSNNYVHIDADIARSAMREQISKNYAIIKSLQSEFDNL